VVPGVQRNYTIRSYHVSAAMRRVVEYGVAIGFALLSSYAILHWRW
jgi:hypothetical protein